MIDTVTLYLEMTGAGIDLKDTVECLLTNVNTFRHIRTGETGIKGYFNGFHVRALNKTMTVNGSLSKFYLGSNSHTLTRQTTKEAIEKLADTFSLPIEQASISRLDIANNMKMEKPVSCYTSKLIEVPYMERDTFGNGQTVLFKNKQKEICIYDKVENDSFRGKSMEKLTKINPVFHKGENILRFETRYKKNLSRQFKRKIWGYQLSQEKTYSDILKNWKTDYLSIKKKRVWLPFSSKKLATDFNQYLMAIALQSEPEMVNAYINDPRLNKLTRSRLRGKIRQLLSNKPDELDSDINELNLKVVEAYENNLNSL